MYSLPKARLTTLQDRKAHYTAGLYWLFFTIYAVFAVYFYFAVIQPYLASGDVYGPRLLADSITYEAICTIERDYLDLATLRDIGPCLGLWIFSYNSGLLSLVDTALVIGSVTWLARVYRRAWEPMLALVLINPVTLASMYSANKEVFGLVSFALLAIFIRTRSIAPLILCLIAALFTRLPAFITTIAFCLLLIAGLPRSGKLGVNGLQRYWILIAGMIAASTLISILFGAALQDGLLGDFSRAEDVSRSTGFSLSLNALSRSGLYAIVYAVRIILNLYSGVIGVTNLLHGEEPNYYTVAVVGSSALFIILSVRLALRGLPEDLARTAEAWNLILFMIFITTFLCLSPVVQHRYFYPIYILLVLFSLRKETSISLTSPMDGRLR